MAVSKTNNKKLSEYTIADLKDFFYELTRKISSKVILIEIGNEFFNIALAKSKNGKLLIKKVYRQSLPKEAIEKSLPTDPSAFGSTILGVLKELKLNSQRVAISIPSDACYTRLIEIPDNVDKKDSIEFLENPDSGIQIPISLNNSDFDISLTTLPKSYKNNKTFNKYFLTSIPQKNVNLILETINAANLELCSIQTSHNCTSNLLRNEIDNLDNENLIISIELLDEFTQMMILDKSGPIYIKRLGSIRNYPSIDEIKKIKIQEKDSKNSVKASGYLPLSKLDLKVLIREIKNSFRAFLDDNNLEKKGNLYLSGRNSQHENLVNILGESLSMDTYLISPSSNYWLEEFTYNPDEINQFSMSRIIGLGLSLIKNLDSQNYLQNANFLVDKFLSKNVHKKLNTENVKDKEKPKIKEKKVESKLPPKVKEDTSDKKQELPPLPNLNIKEKKVESKLPPKVKEDTSDKKQELPPLPNLNIKEKKVESKLPPK
ncbi:pilus assembly protein PilM, partial [Prochlorococcus marinus]